jgi:uncharacterized protein DUF4115
MSLVILLWALTAAAVLIGRVRRGSWKTVRRYQRGQRAIARLGPEPSDGPRHAERCGPDAGCQDGDDVVPHVRLIEEDRLPRPRAAFGGEPYSRIARPGWARMAADLDQRPSVAIDSRAWARPTAAGAEPAAADRPPTPGRRPHEPAPVRPRPPLGPSEPDPSTMAALIRVAAPRPRKARRWMASTGPQSSRPATLLIGAGVTVVAILATGAAAAMLSRPGLARPGLREGEASVNAQRAASTHPASSGPRAPTPTASAAPAPAARVVSTGAQGVTIAVISGSTVDLSASAPCWILARAAATGAVLTEATLAAGQTASIPFQDGLWIRLGNPAGVTVLIGGQPLALPGQPGQPMNLLFSRQPA